MDTRRRWKIAAGLLGGALVAGAAYAVPPVAQASPAGVQNPAPVPGDHLSVRLNGLVAADEAGAGRAATARALGVLAEGPGSLLRTPDGGRYVVDIRLASYSDAAVRAIEAAGGRLVIGTPESNSVTVSVLPQDLPAIGDVAGVEYVGEELTPMFNAVCDTTISEGDAILHANGLRATGVDGTGVKVGVLSDSYNTSGNPINAAADIASDNLPGAGNTCGHTSVSAVTEKTPASAGTDEGRGMMQIVHDLAPGASIDFESASTSEPSFAAGITKLADQGAKVIVDDVTYFDEPMYQDGIVAQAVSGVRARGVDYFSSAANNRYVKNGHEVGSYEAVNGYRPTLCPAIVAITTGHVDCHNFGTAASPDSTFSYTVNSGTQVIRALVNWAEPWNGGVNTDLDAYLVDQTSGTVAVAAETVNAGVGDQQAFEFLGVQHTGASAHNFGIVIARKSSVPPASTPRFKMVFAENGANPFATLDHETPAAGTGDVMGPTTFGHNAGADTVTVGASSVAVATNLNSYSSYGPVTTLFGPVNGLTPASALPSPKVLAKPELVASDCNHTTFFAGPSHVFCGTSSAAPHAAAVAALLRQKYPTASVAAINSALTSTAHPIAGVPGAFQGAGLIDALAANNPLRPVPDTAITKAPKKTVKSKKKKLKVTFQFTSTVAGSTFACSIDNKAFTPCTSGVSFKLKIGKHTFAVQATANGVPDPTPATTSFKIKKKKKKHHTHHHH